MASIAPILNGAAPEYTGRVTAAEARPYWPWISLGLQLGAALLLVHEFRLESRTFFNVALLIVGGFLVHAMLPLRARMPTFAAISIASVGIAFGVRDAAVLLLFGIVLIGICHLPARLGLRVLLLLAVGSLIVAARGNVLAPLGKAFESNSIIPFGVWAILGSMFMFRLALYLHALQTRTADEPKPTIARTLAYFFMAPNVCFPLFPVVDYNLFTKNYYDRPALEIYQTGTRWIARGLFQLLLYRVIYSHVANDPAWLRNLGELLQYVISTYLLYFRVSGSFHLIVGMLCLFGFRLPETHHLYFLATSFTDLWRRINIYWKDFMMKLVYYPSFFRLRKTTKSAVLPLVGATLLVFVATWALHSYQWYWLRGEVLLSWPDVLFWCTLGALVVWNSLREARRGRQRAVSTGPTGWRDWQLSRGLRVVGMFTAMCLLWSFWSAEAVFDWVLMWRAASNVRPTDVMILLGLLLVGVVIGGRSWDTTHVTSGRRPWYKDPAFSSFVLLLAPLVLSRPEIQRQFGPQTASFLESLQHSSLNSRDEARQHRGYYEKMDADARLTVTLWENTPTIPADFVPFQHTIGRRNRNDFLLDELRPSTSLTFHNRPVTINRWGMRGPDIPLEKPPGTLRIATIGPSYMFGWGVSDSGRIQPAMEQRLNSSAKHNGWPRIEVLDFSFPAFAITQQLAMLDDRVYNFSPDLVLVSLDRWTYRHLEWHLDRVIAHKGLPIPYAGLRELLATNGIDLQQQGRALPFSWLRSAAGTVGFQARPPQKETRMRIRELSDTIVAWSLAEIARSIRAHHAIPVVVAFQMIEFDTRGAFADVDHLLRIATGAGITVIDVRDVLRGLDPAFLRVTDWETHPNARGNRLLGNHIAAQLEPHILQRLGSTQWKTSSVR